MRKHTLGVLALVLIVSLHPVKLVAGVWNSGGGELVGDKENPWFVNNVSEVSYCIDIDEVYFGLSRPMAMSIIAKAFGYWRSELRRAALVNDNGATLQIAPIRFVLRASCDQDVDLAFQLGSLNFEQRQLISKPEEFVALAFRSNYDEARLHGRGFIYVSPESGPLRPSGQDLLEHFWSEDSGLRFQLVLLHELGHVFGVQHYGKARTLMSSNFPENLIQKASEIWLPTFLKEPEIFKFRGADFHACVHPSAGWPLHQMLQIASDLPCIRIEVNDNRLDVFASETDGSVAWIHQGAARFVQVKESTESLVHVRISQSQRVFPNLSPSVLGVSGLGRFKQKVHASYKSDSGIISRDLLLDLAPGCFSISGLRSNELLFDLVSRC